MYMVRFIMKFLFSLGNVDISVFQTVHLYINIDLREVLLKVLQKGWDLSLLVDRDDVDVLLAS